MGETLAQLCRTGFEWQATEATRLATECRMLEADADPDDIDNTVLALAQRAASAWADLIPKLKRRQKARIKTGMQRSPL
jgi:hypothetical protein